MYFALVPSRLQYGICAWRAATETTIKPVYVAQKKVICLIDFKTNFEPSLPLLNSTVLIFLQFTIIYILSDKVEILIPKPRLEIYTNYYDYFLALKIFNHFPVFIKSCV